MTAHDDLDRQLNAFLSEGPTELPDPSFDAVRDRTEQTRQRVVIGPWRFPDMNKFVPIGLGAAAVVVVLVAGTQLVGRSPSTGVGGVPAVTPPASAAPTATPEPSAVPTTPPPLTQTFTSAQHGISMSYPEGWIAEAATEPWTARDLPVLSDPFADKVSAPVIENLHLRFASQPIGDSAPDEWVAETLAADCPATEPIAVDGVTGLIGAGDCYTVAVATAGRGYWIRLNASKDDPVAIVPYDRAWFEEVLATVQLQPEDAVAVTPPGALTQTFTSAQHGISMSYPEGWITRAATEPWPGTGGPNFPDPYADVLYDPVNDNLILMLGSRPIGDSTPEEWIAKTMADDDDCSATEPIAVDGATGLIGANDCHYVYVTTEGRGYRIRLYTPYSGPGEVPPADFPYDRAWFEEVLATVQLQPEDAVDVAPSATP